MKRIVLCAAAACFATSLLAQDISGTIEGTVVDASGSAVPNAKVTITNTDRNQAIRTITTKESGVYSAPQLPIGNYSVNVEAPGFKASSRTGIVLNVNDVLKINFAMEVGAVTETIEVKEAAIQVDMSTPANATTIEGAQIRELPLGTRNYEQLVALMPGVASNAVDDLYIGNSLPSGSASVIPYSVNGARNSANNWTVDGADNVDRGSNLTLSTFPSVDSISQFKVERSLYTADTGRAGGATINVVTKSGSKQFHGTVYEFFRNNVLNANPWTNNANRVNLFDSANPLNNCSANFTSTCYARRTPVRWNDFGYTIGGPVYFGGYNKDRNKTFFFFSQEFHRIINYATFNPTLPTQSMLQGNFIQPVCITQVTPGGIVCPAESAPVTQIPASMFNPTSVTYIKDMFSKLTLLDGNTVAATTSGFFPVRNVYNARQEIGKIDHYFSDKFQIWGRFTIDDIPTTEAGGLFGQASIPNVGTTSTNSPGRGIAVHATNIIRPTIVNDASFNFSQSAIVTVPIGLTAKVNSPDINPKEPFQNPAGVIPTVTFTGGSSINGAGPYSDYNRNYNFADKLSWIKGRHTLAFGVSANRYQKTENGNGAQGSFSFQNAGLLTGTTSFQQAWANFLLGNVSSFAMPSQDITPNVWAWQTEAYAQDDFKMKSNLTLYMGVRWSYFGQPIDKNGQMTNFDPALYDPAKAPQIDPATGSVVPGTANWQTNGIIIGGKNSPFGSKISNDKYTNFAPRVGIAWDPFRTGKTSIRAGYGISYDATLFGTYEQNIFANPPFVASANYANASFTDVTSGTAGISPLSPQATSVLALHATQLPANVPYIQQWSLNVQRQLPTGVVMEVGYVGSKGTHLLGAVDLNEAYPGAALAAGLHQPNGNTVFTATDENRINAVKPYRGFAGITAIESAFDSNYNALQIMVTKSFRGAGLISGSYTWSKALTDNSSDRGNAPQNSYNWHEGEYGRASFDRTQVFSANYFYTLPFFRGAHGLIPATIGGWEVSGIVNIYTGQPVTVTTGGVDPAGLGILSTGPASVRPDEICNPNSGALHQYAGAAQSAGAGLMWFNSACFAAVPQGVVRPGNAGRFTVQGPGYFNWDASLVKNFKLNGDGRWRAQLRGDASNALNWVNPSGISIGTTSTTFGQITSFRAARRIQLGLKISF